MKITLTEICNLRIVLFCNWIFLFLNDTNNWKLICHRQFSCLVVPDSLWPHGLQHAKPPCPSPTPRACSNSCSLSRWCHPTILSSVVPFSSCLQSVILERIIDTSLFSKRHKAIKRLQILSNIKMIKQKTSVVHTINYSRCIVLGLSRGSHWSVFSKTTCTMHTHTDTYAVVNTRQCLHL